MNRSCYGLFFPIVLYFLILFQLFDDVGPRRRHLLLLYGT